MPEVLIQAENVGKKFCRDLKKSLWYGVKDSMCDLLQVSPEYRTDTLRDQEFWANSDITFQVQRGECLGLIGGNGAGKTTLLKMLSGLIKPDTGNITVKGRVGALIAIGAGFNPVLTGRENIMVYGSILGMSIQQTKDKLDQIIDFAEINDAIDSPVRTYSSGMNVRLGFSTAVNLLKPDILLLDEVLAVGDLGFRRKCYAAVDELLENAAVIFVTHSMDHVRYLCQNVLLMTKGQATFSDLGTGVAGYLEQQQNKFSDTHKNLIFPPLTNFATSTKPQTIRQNKAIQAEFTISTDASINVGKMVITVLNERAVPVARWDSEQLGLKFTLQQGANRFSVALGPLSLSDADYEIHVSLIKQGSIKYLISDAFVGKFTSFCGRRPLEEGAHLLTNHGFRINGREHKKTTSVSV